MKLLLVLLLALTFTKHTTMAACPGLGCQTGKLQLGAGFKLAGPPGTALAAAFYPYQFVASLVWDNVVGPITNVITFPYRAIFFIITLPMRIIFFIIGIPFKITEFIAFLPIHILMLPYVLIRLPYRILGFIFN